ncbi:TPA: hypothetical protein PXR61_001980 [Yersinia enterocolitica]|nr:hypothetical protein [Yersinia enterocolitica]
MSSKWRSEAISQWQSGKTGTQSHEHYTGYMDSSCVTTAGGKVVRSQSLRNGPRVVRWSNVVLSRLWFAKELACAIAAAGDKRRKSQPCSIAVLCL